MTHERICMRWKTGWRCIERTDFRINDASACGRAFEFVAMRHSPASSSKLQPISTVEKVARGAYVCHLHRFAVRDENELEERVGDINGSPQTVEPFTPARGSR